MHVFISYLRSIIDGAIYLTDGGNYFPPFVSAKAALDIEDAFLELDFKVIPNIWQRVEFLKALFALW